MTIDMVFEVLTRLLLAVVITWLRGRVKPYDDHFDLAGHVIAFYIAISLTVAIWR